MHLVRQKTSREYIHHLNVTKFAGERQLSRVLANMQVQAQNIYLPESYSAIFQIVCYQSMGS